MMSPIKLNKKWKPLFTSDCQYYLLTGGRGSGKSYAISYFALSLISLQKGHRIAVYRATMVSSKLSIMQDMKDMVGMLPNSGEFEVKESLIKNTRTGSEIFFKGIQTSRLDYTAALKGLSNCTTFILDEAEELVDEALWDKIDDTFRATGKQLRLILSLNPTTKEHWIYDRFIHKNKWNEGECGEKDDVCYIHTSYLDNLKHLEPKKVAKWEKAKEQRPEYYAQTVLGGWRDRAEGVVFNNWEYGDFVDTGDTLFGMDFGFSNPSTLVKVSIDNNRGIIYAKLCLYMEGLTETQLTSHLIKHTRGYTVIADSADPSKIEGIRKSGYVNIHGADKGQDSVSKGISLLHNYKIIVEDDEKGNLGKELNNYVYDTKSAVEKPLKEYDHAIDALRYAVYYRFTQQYSSNLDMF